MTKLPIELRLRPANNVHPPPLKFHTSPLFMFLMASLTLKNVFYLLSEMFLFLSQRSLCSSVAASQLSLRRITAVMCCKARRPLTTQCQCEWPQLSIEVHDTTPTHRWQMIDISISRTQYCTRTRQQFLNWLPTRSDTVHCLTEPCFIYLAAIAGPSASLRFVQSVET